MSWKYGRGAKCSAACFSRIVRILKLVIYPGSNGKLRHTYFNWHRLLNLHDCYLSTTSYDIKSNLLSLTVVPWLQKNILLSHFFIFFRFLPVRLKWFTATSRRFRTADDVVVLVRQVRQTYLLGKGIFRAFVQSVLSSIGISSRPPGTLIWS